MRFRLLRRRLTISAPTLSVRAPIPYPLRWVMAALVLGLCAALALWAYDFGKHITGTDKNAQSQVVQLQQTLTQLQQNFHRIEVIANTSSTLLTSERSEKEALRNQIEQLQNEKEKLKEQLHVYENLLQQPAGKATSSIKEFMGKNRELWRIENAQVFLKAPSSPKANTQTLSWEMQISRDILPHEKQSVPPFKLQLQAIGERQGKAWSHNINLHDTKWTTQTQSLNISKLSGTLDIPSDVHFKNLQVKLLQGSAVKAFTSISL